MNKFAFFYSILSPLPLTLFFQREFNHDFLHPILYILIQVVILMGAIPLFRAYIEHNIYTFEDNESTFSVTVLFVVFFVGLGAAILSVKLNYILFFLSFPYIVSLLFAYAITALDVLKDHKEGGIVKLSYIHFKSLSFAVNVGMTIKFIFLVILYLTQYVYEFIFPVMVSFISDLILHFILRARLFQLTAQKDGFGNTETGGIGVPSITIVTIFSAGLSILTGGDRSLLSLNLLKRFLNWLLSFSKHLPNRSGTIDLSGSNSGPTSGEMQKMNEYWESIKGDYEFLRIIYSILGYVLFSVVILVIFIFLFYPFLAPFWSKEKKRVSFIEYYKSIFRKLEILLFQIVKWGKSFKEGIRISTGSISHGRKDSERFFTDQNAIKLRKYTEMRYVKKQYMKLIRTAGKKIDYRGGNYQSVEDFFSFVSRKKTYLSENSEKISLLMNKSFFSPNRLNRSEIGDLRTLMKIIIQF